MEEELSPDKFWAEQCDNVNQVISMQKTKTLPFIRKTVEVCGAGL